MLQIYCVKDRINTNLDELMNHIEDLEEKISDLTAENKQIPKDMVIDLCLSKSMVDELLRLRLKGL